MEEKKKVLTSLKDVPEVIWKKLAQKRVYFGHQSVGNNILSGIQDLMKEDSRIKLNIVETHDLEAFKTPLFAHSIIGKNMIPESKCNAFVDYMEKGLGGKVDIALFKFCFVDVTGATDVNNLFNEYKKTVSRIKEKYPGTTLVHVTVPLMTVQTRIKARIKQIIGRPIGGYDDNAARGEYNDSLRREYEGKEPIFDLARVESTFPDGTRAVFRKEGKTYDTMVPDYTDDGGHLNEKGHKLAAEQFLLLLANLSK
jgi:hypothetical protein